MTMMKVSLLVLVAAGLALPAAARRGGSDDDHCTSAPRSQWQPMTTVEAKAKGMGYSVWKTEISGTCYEVYGRKDGQTFELYFNPATAELVKIERD